MTKSPSLAIITHACSSRAGIAQLVEQLICNQQVGGSSPSTSSNFPAGKMRKRLWMAAGKRTEYGGIPEWPKGTDCKSAGTAFGGSNPPSPSEMKKAPTGAFFISPKVDSKGAAMNDVPGAANRSTSPHPFASAVRLTFAQRRKSPKSGYNCFRAATGPARQLAITLKIDALRRFWANRQFTSDFAKRWPVCRGQNPQKRKTVHAVSLFCLFQRSVLLFTKAKGVFSLLFGRTSC